MDKHLPKINITIKIHFRWRGENVSTIEVESILSNVLQQQDTIVYGVQVPGVEGRAGMAAIVQPEGGIDLNWFLSAIKNQLPSYAMPIFLRMVKELDITGMHNYIIIFSSSCTYHLKNKTEYTSNENKPH